MIHSLPSSEPLTAQKLFSKLYVSYYARLVRFASLYVGAMGDAENIVQDFSSIYGNVKRYFRNCNNPMHIFSPLSSIAV